MHTTERVKIIGLTGQSGSGKSTVSNIFAQNGFFTVDADYISRQVAEFPAFLSEVSVLFPDCVNNDGLNRQKLAGLVFSDTEKLKQYTSIIFPYIVNEIFKILIHCADSGIEYVLLDAPTLFESNLNDICVATVCVTAPTETLINRIVKRDGISGDFAKLRLSAMKPAEWYISKCDYSIVNNSDIGVLTDRVIAVINLIKESV